MDGENDCPPCADEGDTDIGIDTESYGRLLFASSMLLSMTEYAIGMWYAKSAGRTGGEMRLLGAGSLFGYLTMMEIMAASLDADFFNRREAIRFVPAMMLAGGIGGLFLGHAVGRWDRYTEGDAALLETGMMLGTYLPVSILITAKSNDPQLYYGLMLPGTVIGAIGSYFLLRGLDFSHLDAFLINLGTLAGGLVTTGIGFLATMETKQYEGLAVASSVGLIAGYGVMYAVFRNKGLRQAADEDARQSWHFRIHPEGVMTALTRPAAATPRSEEDLRLLREMPATPIVSFEYRW